MQNIQLVKHTLKDMLPPNLADGTWAPANFQDTPEAYIHDLARARVSLAEADKVIRAQQDHIRHLQDMALTDDLTGLLNRRGFTLALQRELSLARRDNGVGGSMVMIDLDGFKTINDLWGHGVGDDYLQAVAHALLSSVRSGDIVARLGGDEFAILFVKMDEQVGRRRLARLEATFNSRMVQFADKSLALRASFGLSVYDGISTPEEILAEADSCMYAQKATRKNRNLIPA